jgi:hypothetical protein
MIKFRITRAYTPGKPLTATQRTSHWFAEEPRIGSTVLRRCLPYVEFTEEQFANNQTCIKNLLISDAIEIDVIDGEGNTLGHIDYETYHKNRALDFLQGQKEPCVDGGDESKEVDVEGGEAGKTGGDERGLEPTITVQDPALSQEITEPVVDSSPPEETSSEAELEAEEEAEEESQEESSESDDKAPERRRGRPKKNRG